MAQAGHFNTTRRGVFAGAAGLATVSAAIAAVAQKHDADMAFVQAIASIHPNGSLAARHALASGMRPESLWAVAMPGVEGNYEPALCFTQDGKNYTFRPTGLDH